MFCPGMEKHDIFLEEPTKAKSLSLARGVVCSLVVRESGLKGTEAGWLLHIGPTGIMLAVRRGGLKKIDH